MSFALRSADKTPVTVITKSKLMESNSSQAQGVIAAVMRPPDMYREQIKGLMWKHVGINRDRYSLNQAAERLDELYSRTRFRLEEDTSVTKNEARNFVFS